MSVSLAKEQAALTKDAGKLKGILVSIKKLFAKEFLWVLFILLLALPLALAINYILETYSPEALLTIINNLLEDNSLFAGAYALIIAGIYFTRTVVGAIKTLTEKPKS